jgi:hypothetical protein
MNWELDRSEHHLAAGRKLIAEQRERIAQQRRLIDEMDMTGSSPSILRDARDHLRQMIATFERMLVALHITGSQAITDEEISLAALRQSLKDEFPP